MRQILTIVLSFFSFLILIAQPLSPSQFLGYELGSQFTRHHQVVDYFKHVEAVSPSNVKLQFYGTTNERRQLLLAIVASEEHMQKIEEVRLNNLKNIGLAEGTPSTDLPAIVWLSYNVHGNEASSTEASMLTIYKLLTEKNNYLSNTIVIIDPCINPDGRDRYVNWYNQVASNPYNADRQSTEHNEPWPGGRPNHYLFDLNRDWAWATQVETQQRLVQYNKWMPHIHIDFHEQGINEPYFFAPAAEPFHEVITDFQRSFQFEIGKNNAKYFDENGWLYFTRERFDLFYPSYGDTYPTFMGAIGLTYEQAGHGMAGLGIITDEQSLLTLKDRLNHHTVAGLSTVETAHKNAKILNEELKKFFQNNSFKYKSYVLQGSKDKINRLKELLMKHDIKFGSPNNQKVTGYKYSTETQGSINTNAADLVVSTNQPKGNMVKVLFEPNAMLSDSLTYDITAWSLPYAYGLEGVASTSIVEAFEVLERLYVAPLEDAYAYVAKWDDLNDARFLSALLKANIKVRFTEKPFTQNGVTYKPGSLIISKADNQQKDFVKQLEGISLEYARTLQPLKGGFSDNTPDIGSPDVKLIHHPKIAVLSGDGISSLNFGELWHFFEKQLEYPITNVNSKQFNRLNLNNFNTIILPSGYYNNILNEAQLNNLKEWVSKGGKLIALEDAVRSFAGKEGFGINYKETEASNNNNAPLPYAERERAYANQMITGAIFKTDVDATHPLAFGYTDVYHTLKLDNTN